MFDHIAVVGAGAWGSALANVVARAGRAVLLAARDQDSAERLTATRHSPHLPDVRFDDRIGVAAATEAVGRYDAVLLAVPSQHLRAAA
ncbi:MAG: NAD(P)-binding domain-containing protein, partial [Alphaproteobacteria bacterium]